MAAYQNHFVVSVLHNNKPQREYSVGGKRVVHLPFGSEYKLRVKSRFERRALVSVEIDGTDVLNGKRLVLDSKGQVDLERFVTDLTSGSKFKFMSLEEGMRTGQIQDPTSPENGKITVKIWREVEYFWTLLGTVTNRPTWTDSKPWIDTGYRGGCFSTNSINHLEASCNSGGFVGSSTDFGNKGATVEGGRSDQQFQEVSSFQTEASPIEIEIWIEGNKMGNFKEEMKEAEKIVKEADCVHYDELGEIKRKIVREAEEARILRHIYMGNLFREHTTESFRKELKEYVLKRHDSQQTDNSVCQMIDQLSKEVECRNKTEELLDLMQDQILTLKKQFSSEL